jgi:3-keto-5-aminohexanoate cleavage enzyme
LTDPVIIQCAVTGSAAPDPERNPNLPLAPGAIIASALEAWRAGAAVLHLHAREDDGTPTQDAAAFTVLVDGLRDAGCDAIVNLSCGTAGGRALRDERLGPLTLKPEMASLDSGSINFGDRIFEGDVPFLRRMAAAFAEHGVRPELECFDTGHVGLALMLRDEGLLADPLLVQFVLGVPGTGVPATVEMVEHLRRMLPPGAMWSVCGIGRAQLPLNAYCILAGGHVRTGLEDNLWFRAAERATNGLLVERVVRLAAELERPVATPDMARSILGLKGLEGPRGYARSGGAGAARRGGRGLSSLRQWRR